MNKKIKQLTILYYLFRDIVSTVTGNGLAHAMPYVNFKGRKSRNEEEITWCSS